MLEVPDASTSNRMRKQRTRETKYETALRKALFSRGHRYRLHRKILDTRRSIDIAFTKHRVAIFVDGCFWHMCPQHGTIPQRNRDWWLVKLEGNASRDRDTDDLLEKSGWRSVRIWEHTPLAEAVAHIETVLASRDAEMDDRSGTHRAGRE